MVPVEGLTKIEPSEVRQVFRINVDGSASEICNGPSAPVWASAGGIQSNGQRVVSLSRLMALQMKVSADQKLQEVSSS